MVVLLLAIATLSSSPARGSSSLVCGRILWARGSQLLTSTPDRTGRRVVVDIASRPGGQAQSPEWSPNGRHIAFVAYDYPSERLMVVRPDGTGLRRIGTGAGAVLSYDWAPSGRRIVVSVRRSGSVQLRIANLRGDHRFLTEGWQPDWSPNGRRITFVRSKSVGLHLETQPAYRDQIFKITPWGAHLRQLTSPENGWDSGPEWSPNGSRIAFTRYPKEQPSSEGYYGDVWIMHADGDPTRRFTHQYDGYNGAAGPVWSPDGEWLAFDEETAEYGWVSVQRISSSTHRRIPSRDYTRWPSWSPSGNRLTFEAADRVGWAWRDGSGGKTFSSEINGAPDWAPC